MADLNLNVNFNPLTQPSPTEVNTQPSPVINTETPNIEQSTISNIANIALVAGAAKNVGMASIGKIGSITGDFVRQQQINTGLKIGGIGLALKLNPIAGGLFAAASFANTAVDLGLEQRNDKIQVDRYNSLTRNRINGGRW